MKLTDDYSLSSVDHECSALCHEGDFAEVYNVFLEGAEVASSCLWVNVPEDQLNRYTKRRGPSHASVPTLVHIVFGGAKVVRNEL